MYFHTGVLFSGTVSTHRISRHCARADLVQCSVANDPTLSCLEEKKGPTLLKRTVRPRGDANIQGSR